MTPSEILEEAKSRFMVLLHNNPDALARLLRQALGKYQDKAGVILEAWQEGQVFELPPHYHAVAGCCDSRRKFVPWRYDSVIEDVGGAEVAHRVIVIEPITRHTAPFCLYYFCDLRNWPLEEPLPGDCDALIADYLEALIAVQNTERMYNAYLTAGMHENPQGLLSQQELRQRVTDLEREMEESKAIVPPASMF